MSIYWSSQNSSIRFLAETHIPLFTTTSIWAVGLIQRPNQWIGSWVIQQRCNNCTCYLVSGEVIWAFVWWTGYDWEINDLLLFRVIVSMGWMSKTTESSRVVCCVLADIQIWYVLNTNQVRRCWTDRFGSVQYIPGRKSPECEFG
jgi:hypothetical protein